MRRATPLPVEAGRIVTISLWVLAAVLAVPFARLCAAAVTRPSAGFVAYYTAARQLRSGAEPARFYDDAAFAAEVRRVTPGVSDIFNVNPPTTSLLVLPLSSMDYRHARTAWTLLSVACVGFACGMLLRDTGLRGAWLPAVLILLFLFEPLAANLDQAQAYGVLLALLTLAWEGFRKRRDWLLGAALGAALILKSAGAPIWLLLLAERRWRALGWGVATVAAVALGSLSWIGLAAWRTYLGLLPGLASRPTMAVTAYQSVPAMIRHLLTRDPLLNPTPLFDVPHFAALLALAVAAATIVVSLWAVAGKGNKDLAFAAFVLVGLLLTPYSLDYHYTLALLPIIVLLAWLRGHRSPVAWAAFAAAAALIAADLPYRSPRLAAGARALLAYPKLAGALVLWAILVCALWIVAREPQAERLAAAGPEG